MLTVVKQAADVYKKIDIHFDRSSPLELPVIVSLPKNGVRLRCDGADQRLRLIEVLDFKASKLVYKNSELLRTTDTHAGPEFRRIYQMFGATYPGEYSPPNSRDPTGQYVLSWAGVAFTFTLQHGSWALDKDHVSLLGSSAASPATRMAIFEGKSWPEVRSKLFVTQSNGPRTVISGNKSRDNLPAELELATVYGNGSIRFLRRSPASPFSIVLKQTTAQDLVTELGAPDAMQRRDATAAAEEPSVHRRANSSSHQKTNGRSAVASLPSSYSSTGTDTFDVDFDSGDPEDDTIERAGRETFWCYFNHGIDVLVGPPSDAARPADSRTRATPLSSSPLLVVIKVIIHGNVPGSYAFNRHRRLRWDISIPGTEYAGELNSETKFDQLKPALLHIFKDVWHGSEMGRGKVVNRTWGAGPSDSNFFLPDAGEDLVEGMGSEQWLGNTRLYTFPGLSFEVLENGAVSALTID